MQAAWDLDNVLPSYTPQSTRRAVASEVEHTYHLMRNGRPLLTLAVKSRATDADSTPIMRQGHNITGCATLDVQEGMQVRAIDLQVIGELRMQFGIQRFLSIRQELYSAESKESENAPSGRSAALSRGRIRLVGRHVWPYSIKLPKGVSILNGAWSEDRSSYRLPSSFDDNFSKVSVKYYLQVRIKTGLLSSGHKLTQPFQYSPLLRPPAPSILRQIAQLEGYEVPGPDDDPEGWRTLPTVTVEGKVFSSRSVAVTCMLSLPAPLCYTRGTTIPIHLILTSDDTQALDLLSSTHAPDIRLRHNVAFSQGASSIGLVGGDGPQVEQVADLASAKFSVASQANQSRFMRGELTIPADIVPECHILHYSTEYTITMHHFTAVAFSPAPPQKGFLLSQRVQIATVDAADLRSSIYAPPQYTPVAD